MKKRVLPLLLACLLLAGCGWLDGTHVSVTPHQEDRQEEQTGAIFAASYQELVAALEELTAAGTETAVITVVDYPQESVERGMETAVRHMLHSDPIGAYAVEDIHYELGTSSGLPALAVTISYRFSWAQIRQIRHVSDMEAVRTVVIRALENYSASSVVLVEAYAETDFAQMVEDYALENPQTVMETPQVTVNTYGSGSARVVELVFTYQNSRDVLRQMKSQVEPVFNSAVLYVSGDGSENQKFSQLFAFLMERFDYTVETSITPAYSLLRHGVGDSRAFATVYAAMCRSAGLECGIVTGTYSGEPRTWNMVLDNGYYYHVDLLRCSELGGYRTFTDREMRGYVWDYSAHPASTGAPAEPETTETGGTQSAVDPTQETTTPETQPEPTEEERQPDQTAPQETDFQDQTQPTEEATEEIPAQP